MMRSPNLGGTTVQLFLKGIDGAGRSKRGVTHEIRIIGGVAIAFALLVVAGFPVAAAIEIVDLGSLGGQSSVAIDVGERGHVTGVSLLADGTDHAFLWTPDSGMVDLGAPRCCYSLGRAVNSLGQVVGDTGDPVQATLWSDGTARILGTLSGGGSSQALDINDLGQVVGWSDTVDSAGIPGIHAFLWSAESGMTDLGSLNGLNTEAFTINNVGEVMGGVFDGPFPSAAFFWTPEGGMVNIGDLGGGFTSAFGMNELGQIAGTSATVAGCCHPFLWTPGAGMTDLGTLGSNYGVAAAVNNLGHVAGESDTADGLGHTFLWRDGTMTDLGTLGGRNSFATAINDFDQVAGTSEIPSTAQHAFVWMEQTGMLDLGTLGGGGLTTVNAMNNAGQIVGFSSRADGSSDATLWNVGPPPPPPTPEERIRALSDSVEALLMNGKLNQGEARSLTQQLASALHAIGRQEPSVAVDELHAFLNHLDALEQAGQLSSTDAQPIADATNRLIQDLGG